MPRAHRYFLPGQIWHITHRCHKQSFLLAFARDRRNYLGWLFEARKRFGLCVLDYMVTSNHVHLLLKDTHEGAIARGMQLVAGRTAQEFNDRRNRQGAFWEDRYHATAVESNEHLHNCLAYMGLNMVRAGVVTHPAEWVHGGYREIHDPRERYRLIDLETLSACCGFSRVSDFQRAHGEWIAQALASGKLERNEHWSAAIAVGSHAFVANVKSRLRAATSARKIVTTADGFSVLREDSAAYRPISAIENDVLTGKNGPAGDQIC